MVTNQIRFDDGAAYERYMGTWSQLAGATFLDWLAPKAGLRWLDIGCGNGAFTERLIARCAPSAVHGIDPSEGQLAFEDLALLKARMRARLPADASGRITLGARANAVRGRVKS